MSLRGAAITVETCSTVNCIRPTIIIQKSTFSGNRASFGGAVFASDCNIVITESAFRRNVALSGGAIYISGIRSKLEITNSSFKDNTASSIWSSENKEKLNVSSEYSGIGGAISAVDPSSVVISRVQFTGNAGLLGGGALSVLYQDSSRTGRLSVTFSVSGSNFANNIGFDENTDGNNLHSVEVKHHPLNAGGAILYLAYGNLDVNWNIVNSTFRRNFAQTAGALYIFSSLQFTSYKISNCNFSFNRARVVAGGILIVQTELQITESRFYRNIGFYGGALCAADGSRLIVSSGGSPWKRTVFRENEAFIGGGCHLLFGTSLRLEDASFIDNVAYRDGGGIALYTGEAGNFIFGGLFKGNRAVIGGAIVLYLGGGLNISSYLGKPARFINNTAMSGGAIYVGVGHTIFVTVYLNDAEFIGNFAVRGEDLRTPKNEVLQHKLRGLVPSQELSKSEEELRKVQETYSGVSTVPAGSGGAIALALESVRSFMIGDIHFHNVSIEENQAIVGGGVGVYMQNSSWNNEMHDHCVSRTFTVYTCQRFFFENVNITRNAAEYGGGLFVTNPESIGIVCDSNNSPNGAKTLHEVTYMRMTQNRTLDFVSELFCTDIHDNKILGKNTSEAADIGTSAVSLAFVNPNDTLRETASGDMLELACENEANISCDRTVKIAVKDKFNQTIHGGVRDSYLTIALSSAYILGDRRYTASHGIVEINNTFTHGVNVSSYLEVTVVGNEQILLLVNFSTRACRTGEFTQNNLCQSCLADRYGYNGSMTSCQSCEENFICKGNATRIPQNGYWHSTPFSPIIHRCIRPKACDYEERELHLVRFFNSPRRLQRALEKLEKYIQGKGDLPQYSQYMQCAEGNEGVLCGTCSTGFGHSFSGECKPCPDSQTKTRLLLALSFIWTLILIGTNCGLTLQSTKAKIQLEVHETRLAHAQHPETLPRSNAMSTNVRNASHSISNRIHSFEAVTRMHTTPEAVGKVLIRTVQLTETLKILVNYLQVTSAASNLSTDWGAGVESLLTVEASLVGVVSGFFLVPLECDFPDINGTPRSIIALWARFLTPFGAMFVLIAILALFHGLIDSFMEKRCGGDFSSDEDFVGSEHKIYSLSTGIVVVVVVSVYFSFITVISQFLTSLYCIKVDHGFQDDSNPYSKYAILDEYTIWAEDTSLRCFHGKHLPTAIAGLIGLSISLFLIVFVIVWLPMNIHLLHNPTFIARYWFIYQGYKKEWYTISWEAMIFLRKALITAVVVYSVNLGPTLQAPLCVGIMILAHFVHFLCQPFKTHHDQVFVPEYSGSVLRFVRLPQFVLTWIEFNNSVNLNDLESLSISASVFLFLSATVFDSERLPKGGKVAMAVFTLLFNWTFLAYMLYRIYAGIHVLLDAKLEALNSHIFDSNNGMGIRPTISKTFFVLKNWFSELF
eukprot:g4085.t1